MAAVDVGFEPLARGPQCVWVAVNAYEVSIVWRERSKQCGRMAAAAGVPSTYVPAGSEMSHSTASAQRTGTW